MSQIDLFGNKIIEDVRINREILPNSHDAQKMTLLSGVKLPDADVNGNKIGLLEQMSINSPMWTSYLVLLIWKLKTTERGNKIFHLSVLKPTVTNDLYCKMLPKDMHTGVVKRNDVVFWLTPSATNIEPSEERFKKRTAYRESIGRHYEPGALPEQVAYQKMWQTPSANDAGRKGSKDAWLEYEEEGRTTQCRLRNQVQMWPMSADIDLKSETDLSLKEDHSPSTDVVEGTLNPNWVEWLMGFPKDWTKIDMI